MTSQKTTIAPRRRHARADALTLAIGLLALGAPPTIAQSPTERERAALIPAQATAPQPNGLGMRAVQVTVPSVMLAEPASEVRLAIELEPADGAPRGSFMRIRGLPPTAALSDGHAIAPGAWAVPTAALKGLRVIVPAGTAGRSEITVALVTLDGTTIAEAKGSLVVAAARLIAPRESAAQASTATASGPVLAPPPPLTATPVPPSMQAPKPEQQQAARPPVPSAEPPGSPAPIAVPKAPSAPAAAPEPPAAKELSPSARQKAENLLGRGRALLGEGNIALARLFFERSADEGLAEGALAMGSTYDPAELQRMRVQGTQPDPQAARRWYERARSLGSRDAEARLNALAGR